jgi:hypothetical protein
MLFGLNGILLSYYLSISILMPPHMVSLAFIVNVDVSSLYVPEKVLLATKSAILIKFTTRFSDLTSTKTMYINPLYREVAPYMRNDA